MGKCLFFTSISGVMGPYPTPLKLQSWSLMLCILWCTPWYPPFFDRNICNFESSFIFHHFFTRLSFFFFEKNPTQTTSKKNSTPQEGCPLSSQEDLSPEGPAAQLLVRLGETATTIALAEVKVVPLMDQAEPSKMVRLVQGIPVSLKIWWKKRGRW